ALEQLESSAALFTSLETPLDTGISSLEAARVAAKVGQAPQAQSALQAAHRHFSELNAKLWVEQAEALSKEAGLAI
ncbi:MAG: hypothetical protein AAGM22_32700, partial [Acidobacteriota bacterium]